MPADSLEAKTLKETDPRWSRIFRDTLAAKAALSPVIQELPPATGPREVQLSGRKAVVSPNIRMHPSTTTTQSEMSITTHPLNPEEVLAGANAAELSISALSQGWYHTTDGGATWGGGDTLPTHLNLGNFMSDPAVGIDLDGRLFFNALEFGATADVFIARSTDNGTSWSKAIVPSPTNGEDKNHMAIDVNPSSPFEGYVYTGYTDFDFSPGAFRFSRSTNSGVSFSAPISISGSVGSYFAQGANLAAGPNGELYAAWSGYDAFPPVTTHLGFNKSTDGGATWQGAVSIRDVFDIRGQLNKGGNFVRVNSFPSMAVDRSSGPRNGWIYIVYAEKNPTTPDIFLIRSSDGGATWSAPRQVNQDASGKDQWFSWISVDPATGHLYVVYYDSRNFPANDSAQVYISSSADGGDTFEDLLVSDVAFLPTPIPGLAGGYMGDYIGISALNGVVWPSWNDNRTGIHQGYTSRIVFLEVGSPPKISVSPDSLDFETVFLGYPETLSVSVRNLGFPETLQVSNIVSDNPDFTPEITNFILPGGSVQKLKVAFNPSATGLITASLTITSNDTANPTVTVTLKGEGLVAPDISVSPDSFKMDLFTGDVAVETLTIANTGGSDLNFAISIGEQTALALQARPLRLQALEKSQSPSYKPLKNWQDYREMEKGNESVASAGAAALFPPLPIVITDPAGDGGGVDITILRGSGGSGQLQIQMEFATTIVPTNFGGYLSLDIDQNQATGVSPSVGKPGQDIGAEYEFTFFSLGSGIVNLYNAVTGTFVGSYPVVIGTNTLTFSTPLAALGNDDGKMDVTGVIGNSFGPTDWFPDAGHGTIGALDFLAVSPGSGTVPAGFSLDVEVTFDAAGIPGGHFFADLLVSSNDPDEKVDTVPTHLHVIDAPSILLSDDTLDFGDAFVGYPDTLILTVFNDGTELLEVTGMSIDNPRFSVLDAVVFNVPPGDSQNVRVQFLPIAAGPDSGVLSIASTDSTDSIVAVQLLGNGLIPPDISVSPDSLADSLFTGETAVETLTVSNSGGSDLNFEISVEGVATAVSSALRNSPVFISTRSSSGLSQMDRTAFTITDFPSVEAARAVSNAALGITFKPEFAKRAYKLPQTLPGLANILVMEEVPASLHYDAALNNLGLPRTLVTSWPGLESELAGGTPWDLVIVNSYGSFPPSLVLDMLDSFQTSGGRLIYADWSLFDYPLHPLLAGLGISFVSDFTTPINFQAVNAGHPVFNIPNDVSDFSWTDDQYNRDGEIVAVLPGAVQLAAFDGFPASGAVVLNAEKNCLFNAFQAVNFNADGDLDGKLDIVELIENEITLLGGPKFLTASPDSGTVPAGDSVAIEVTFDATGLNGGDYYADLLVSSNDPDEPVDTTPVHLQVTGAPDIELSEDSLDFGTPFVGASVVETLVVSNAGTDSLGGTISSDNPDYTVSPSGFSLDPGENQAVLVTFTPPDSGVSTGNLTIVSNDPDEPSLAVYLQGRGLLPPDIAVSPDSLMDSLFTGEMAVETLTVANSGYSDLIFDISITESGGSLLRGKPYSLPPLTITGDVPKPDHPGSAENQILSSAVRKTEALSAQLADLTGKHIGFMGFGGYGTIQADLQARGASVFNLFFPLAPGALDSLDVLAIDDVIGGASASDINLIRGWLQSGNGLLLQGDEALTNNNLILAETGINESPASFSSVLLTNILPHPTTVGVDTVAAYSYGAFCTVTPPAQTIVFDELIRTHVAVSRLGVGRVIAVGNEVSGDFNFSGGGDTRLFANQIFDWLAAISDFLSVNPTAGAVPAGDSVAIEVSFDATGLNGGDYYADILVSSNDPDEPVDTTPVHLHVTGAPDIAVSPLALDFDTIFAQATAVETVTVSNEGTDLLVVSSISSDNPNFTPNLTGFSLNPGEDQKVAVTFSPTDSGTFTGQLTIASNDTVDEPTVLVALQGVALLPPDIAVSPDSLMDSLFTGEMSVETLTIANSGYSDLTFDISLGGIQTAVRPVASRKSSLQISPSKDVHPRAGFRITTPFTGEIGEIKLPLGPNRQLASLKNILVIDDGGSASDVRPILEAAGYTVTTVSNDDVYIGTNPAPTGFSAVILLDGISYEVGMPLAGQDSLVAYVNRGGGLLFTEWVAYERSQGRYSHFDSLIAVPRDSGGRDGTETYTVLQNHPITAGLPASFPVSSGSNIGTATAGVVLIQGSQSGDAVVAKSVGSGAVVQYAMAANYGGHRPFTDGNMQTLLVNTVNWLSGGLVGWLSVAPDSGTVPAGDSVAIEVSFDATGLNGGDYYADILVSSNDPDEPVDTTPVHLHVTGAPDIAVSPLALDFDTIFAQATAVETVTVSNEGTDLLVVSSISSDNPNFTPNLTGFSLNPGEDQKVAVTFSPTDSGTFTGQLTIASNDTVDEPTVLVALQGVALLPPDIAVSPDSLAKRLFIGETAVETLTIANSGYSDLHFEVSLEDVTGLSAKVKNLTLFRNSGEALALAAGRPNLSALAKEISAEILAQTGSGGNVQTLPARASMSAAPASVLLLTTTSVSGSVGLALNNLGVPYDLIQTDNFIGIDFSPYATIIVAMDGGSVDEADVQVLANAASSGKKLIMIGGTSLPPYYNGIQLYLLSHTGQQGWVISSMPHLQVTDPSHPLAAGLPASYNFNNNGAAYYMLRINDPNAPGAAINGDSHPILVNKSIGDGTLVYFTSPPDDGFWSNPSDFAILQTIIGNALAFSGGPSWLSANPTSGTVPAGSSAEVEVTFDATGLNVGDYYANILVSSNDPDEPVDTTPVHLHVTGVPNILLSADTLDFGDTFIGYPDTLTLTVSNNGSDVLEVAGINSSNPRFSLLDPSVFNVAPGDSQNVRVQFLPTAAGLETGILAINSTDSVPPIDSVVALVGNGIHPPVMEVSPDSFAFELRKGDSASSHLLINNSGLGTLQFRLQVETQPVFNAETRPVRPTLSGESSASQPATVFRWDWRRASERPIASGHSVQSPAFTSSILLPVIVTDTVGDGGATDIREIAGEIAADHISFQFVFATPLNPSNFGGVLGLDIDQNPLTGDPLPFGIPQNDVGCEYFASFYSLASNQVDLFNSSGNLVGSFPAAVDAQSFSFDLPLSALDNDDGRLNLAAAVGDASGYPTDWIPDTGHGILQFNWLSLNSYEGTLFAGESLDVEVKVKTDPLSLGSFQANIRIASNDPANFLRAVPVLLTVTCTAAKGDMNGDSLLTATDVVLHMNCVFLNEGVCSLCFADLNCDGRLAPADVVLELNAVFLERPFPCL